MAKRFTDTLKWSDPWFRRLNQDLKVLWFFLFENCDQAGFWKKDCELASFFCGYTIDDSMFFKLNAGKCRLKDYGSYIQIVDFIPFQYGRLSAGCRPHKLVLYLLEIYEAKGYIKGIGTLKDKDKDKEIRGVVGGGAGGQNGKPTLEEVRLLFQEKGFPAEAEKFFDYYESNGWRVGKVPMKNWMSASANWLRHTQAYGTQSGVQKREKIHKPSTDCDACGGSGKLPDGRKCWCWQ